MSTFADWHAEAMRLADALVSAQVNDDREHGLIAARSALAAHLREAPIDPARIGDALHAVMEQSGSPKPLEWHMARGLTEKLADHYTKPEGMK